MTGPFFSKNLCHHKMNEDWKTEGANCLSKSDSTACQTDKCIWSSAKEHIPPIDFCAPALMTQDFKTIDDCVEIKSESNCVK